MDVEAFFLRVFLVTLSFFVVFGTEGEEGSPGGVCSRASLILNDGLVIAGDQVEGFGEWGVKVKSLIGAQSQSHSSPLAPSRWLYLTSIRLDLIAQYSLSVSRLSIPRPCPGLFRV